MYRSNHHWWKRLSVSRLNTELKQVIYYLIWLHQWVCLSDRRIFCCSSLNKITNWIFWGFQMSVRRCPKMSSGIFWDILWINSQLIEKIIQSQFRSITLTHSMKNTHSFKTCSQARSGSRPYALCWNSGKFETGSAKQEQEEEVGSLSRFSSQKS